jgi:hypothetical protein
MKVSDATICVDLKMRRNRSWGGTDFSDGIFALLAIRLGSIAVSLSLPHAANGRFKAMISCDPLPGFGCELTDSFRQDSDGYSYAINITDAVAASIGSWRRC